MKRSHAFLAVPVALAALGVAVWLLGGASTRDEDDAPGIASPGAPTEPRLVGRADRRAEPTGVRITGEVVDAEDRPQAGVRVEVVADGDDERRIGTTSDDAGGFALLVPEEIEEGTLAARPSAPHVGTVRRIVLGPRYPTWYRLRVWPGRRLTLQVVDAKGMGARGEVEALRGGTPNRGTAAWSQRTRTDAEGRLDLQLPPGSILLAVSVPGVGTMRRTLPPPLPDELVLRFGHADGETLAGVAEDSGGRPIGGAKVHARVRHGDDADLVRRTTTDAAGRWELEGLPAGRLEEIEAQADGYVPRTVDVDAPVAEEVGRMHRLVLSRECVVTGRVVDAEGRAVAGAGLKVATEDGGTRDATAGADGRFRLSGLPAGRVALHAAPPGWTIPYEWPRPAPGTDVVEAFLPEEGSLVAVTLAIGTGQALRGRVILPGGAPVPGAVVMLRPSGYSHDTPHALPPPVTSAADGSFVFSGIDAWNYVSLTALAEGLTAHSIRDPILELAARDDLEIVLRPPATIAGRVVAGDGGPLPPNLLSRGDVAVWSGGGDDATYGVLDDRGGFVLTGLPAGRHHPHLSAGYGGPRVHSQWVSVDWGERKEGVTLRLVETGTTCGVVVDPHGNPVAHLALAFGDYTVDGRCTTAADGTFHIEGLPKGLHRVTFGDDETVAVREVRAGDTSVRLVHEVQPLRHVAGRVLGPEGNPVPSAGVYVAGGGAGEPWSEDLDSARVFNGRFRLEFRTNAERVTLTVDDAEDASGRPLGTRRAEWTVDVDREGLEIRLEPGFVLAGRIVGEAGEPVADARVLVDHQALVTDAEGRFRREGLADDSVWLEVAPPPPYAPYEELFVEARREDLVVRLARTSRVQGRVLAPDGTPMPAAVRAWGLNFDTGTHSDADGRFELRGIHGEGVSVGVRLTRADRARGWMAPPEVPVPADGEEILLRLRQGVFVEGILVQPSGDPVPRAEVRMQGKGRKSERETVYARDGGRFRIGPVEPGAWALSVESETDGLGDVEEVTVTAPSSGLRIVLPRVPVLRVRVVADDLDDFHVALTRTSAGDDESTRSRELRRDGTFVFDAVDPKATYTLFVHRAEDDRFALATDVSPTAAEIVLPLTTGLDLGGRLDLHTLRKPLVRAPRDTYSRGLEIAARGAPGVVVAASVDLDGSFRFRGLPPGRYVLEVGVPTWDAAGRPAIARGKLADVDAGRRDVVVPVRLDPD